MHYRNGREAKNGDRVVQFGYSDGPVTAYGILKNAVAGNDDCNGTIEIVPGGQSTTTTMACLCDCLHADDIAAILAEKGLDTRPAGK